MTTPIQVDPTMRALMEVHRAQVNQLEHQLASEKQAHQSDTYSAQERERKLADEVKWTKIGYKREKKKVADRDNQIADLTETEARLRDKVLSLQLELQSEREAHTSMRDAAHDAEDGQ